MFGCYVGFGLLVVTFIGLLVVLVTGCLVAWLDGLFVICYLGVLCVCLMVVVYFYLTLYLADFFVLLDGVVDLVFVCWWCR